MLPIARLVWRASGDLEYAAGGEPSAIENADRMRPDIKPIESWDRDGYVTIRSVFNNDPLRRDHLIDAVRDERGAADDESRESNGQNQSGAFHLAMILRLFARVGTG